MRRQEDGFHVIAGWLDQKVDASVTGCARQFSTAMAAHATGGVYVNLIGDDEAHRTPPAFSDTGRVARLNGSWNPAKLLRANHNVPPDKCKTPDSTSLEAGGFASRARGGS